MDETAKNGTGAGRGRRKRRPMAPGKLKALCEAYFEKCDREGREYTYPGLALYIGVTPRTLERWAEAGEEDPVGEIIRKAVARMSDALQQRRDSAAVFLLKQKQYGGYADKQGEKNGGVAIQVSFGTAEEAAELGG